MAEVRASTEMKMSDWMSFFRQWMSSASANFLFREGMYITCCCYWEIL